MVATVPSEPAKSCDPDVGARQKPKKNPRVAIGVVEGLESDDVF